MKQFPHLVLIAYLLIAASSVSQAKIIDCEPIVSEQIKYSSHSNYVEAVEISTGKVLWKTILFSERYVDHYNPNLEEDVQWNIACIRAIQGNEVIVHDGKGRIFKVSKLNGRIVSKKPKN